MAMTPHVLLVAGASLLSVVTLFRLPPKERTHALRALLFLFLSLGVGALAGALDGGVSHPFCGEV